MARGRPANVIKTVERKVRIPEAMDAELQLILFSDLEGRVPYGALSALTTTLLTGFLESYRAAAAAKGKQG